MKRSMPKPKVETRKTKRPAASLPAKLSAPRLAAVIPRAGLSRILDRARRRTALTWIAAPSGAGKTTFVAAYLRSRALKRLWYQIDERDADAATFFFYLREAAARIAPGARRLLSLLTPDYALGVNVYAHNFFERLGALLKPPFVLVFDNYQLLRDDAPVHGLLARVLEALPQGLGAIIVSRNEPPPAFAVLRADRRLTVIDADALALTAVETRQLAASYRFTRLTSRAIENLHERTRGWAAGAVLMLEQAQQEHVREPQFDQPVARVMFDYFAAEVLQRAPSAQQKVLLETAMFSQVSARAAEALTGDDQAGRVLAELARRRYFTHRLAGGEAVYQYHPLFHEFLLTQLNERFSPEEIASLRRRAAAFAEASGHVEDAVQLWRQASAWDELSQYLHRIAQSMLEQGRGKTLASWIDQVPPEVLQRHPWLLYWRAQCLLPVSLIEARAQFERAHALFTAKTERAGALLAWAGIVDTFILEFGELTRLDPWIEWLRQDLAANPEIPTPAIDFRVTSSMTVALLFRLGRREEIEPWVRRATSLLPQTPDLAARCRLAVYLGLNATWIGDLQRLETIALDIARWSEVLHGGASNRIEAQYARYVRTLYEWIAGIPDYGRAAADEALAMVATSGIHIMEHNLVARTTFGALCQGDLDAAQSGLEQICAIATARSSRLRMFQYHYLPGWHALLAGNFPQALKLAQRSLQVSREAGTPVFHQAFSAMVAAQALLELKRYDDAQLHIDAILEIGRGLESPIIDFSGLLLQAECEFARESANGDAGAADRGLAALVRALAIGREHGYMNTVVWYPPAMAALCERALERGVEERYVQDLIARRGLVPASPPVHLANWPWPIRIRALGRFALEKNSKPVQLEGKVQKKALDLLRALIAFGGREIGEQKLCDVLWPGAEADDARGNLKVTLHRLRQFLGNEAVAVRESKLQLDARICWVDAWAFERLVDRMIVPGTSVSSAELARIGEQAMALYAGPLLEAEDSIFVLTPRERLRGKLIRAIAMLGERLQRDGAREEALAWYERALEIEPHAESLYQELMRTYHALHRAAEGLAVYERCRKALGAQLQVAPSPGTEALARALRGLHP